MNDEAFIEATVAQPVPVKPPILVTAKWARLARPAELAIRIL